MEYGPSCKLFDDRRAGQEKKIRFIRLKEVLAICGMSRSSVYDAIKKGRFPKPVKVEGTTTAWVRSEIDQWVQERINARDRNTAQLSECPALSGMKSEPNRTS